MDEGEHRQQLERLIKRVDTAGDRIFDAADRLFDEVATAEGSVGHRTQWWQRWLRQLADHVDEMTETAATASNEASRAYAQRPTTVWGQCRQRRQLLYIATYLEGAATRLTNTRL